MRTVALAAVMTFTAAAPAFADAVEGDWLTSSGSGKVHIAPCAGKPDQMCGAISWLRNPEDARAHDIHNPNPALQTRTILGLPMIWGFHQAGAGRWTGGKIYDPNSGKTYDSKLSVNPNGTLKVEGCILVVCEAQTWRRE